MGGFFKDEIVGRLNRFEDGADGGGPAWLGGPKGLLVGILLLVPAALALILALVAMFGVGATMRESPGEFLVGDLVGKPLAFFMLLVVAAATAYWRRQRLAAHFEFAQRLVVSANSDERQRGLTELIVNARRGRAEHRRIAGALTAYLRRAPQVAADETGRRQLALALLADHTLAPVAKHRLDLTGASLAGLRAVGAELPGVCLRDADLSNVRFTRANLAYADFVGARLDGADFTGARLDGTILAPSMLAQR